MVIMPIMPALQFGGKAVSFGFADAFGVVHGHFHEGVLREAWNGVGVFGDGGMMDMRERRGRSRGFAFG